MPTFPLGKGAFVSVNAQTYSDSIQGGSLEIEIESVDTTTFGSSAHKSSTPGLIDDAVSMDFLYSQSVFAALRTLALARTSHDVIVGPEGNGSGKEKITFTGYITKIGRKVVVDDVTKFPVEWAVTTDATYATW